MYYSGYGTSSVGNVIVLGSGLTTIWSSICFSSAGDIERERREGTLEYLFASPTSFSLIYLGKVLANTFLSLSGFIISFSIATFVLNEPPQIVNLAYFTLSFLLVFVSFISLSLVLGPMFTLSRNSRAFVNSLDYPLFILCGMVVSLDILPPLIRPISYILPPTLAIRLLRESANGIDNVNSYFLLFSICVLICVSYVFLSAFLQKKIDNRARVRASLGVF